MVLGREEGLECEVHIDRIHLEHVLESKYFRCAFEKSGIDTTECSR